MQFISNHFVILVHEKYRVEHKWILITILFITKSQFSILSTSLLAIILLFNFHTKADIKNHEGYQHNYSRGCNQVYDPYEKLNRKIFACNLVFDSLFLRPITIVYQKATNDYIQARVSSFLDNINLPLTSVNYGLQMNYEQTMNSLWRFIINSTFGIGGLFDVASKVGLHSTRQTFGNTLAHYGASPGPYLVIPFLGSTNVRDMTDSLFTDNFFNPIMRILHKDLKIIIFSTQMIDSRLRLLSFSNFVMHNSIDPYIAIRSATHQNRESTVLYPKGLQCPQYNQ